MRSSVIAFCLSACTVAATAQCVATPAAQAPVNAARPAGAARPSPELITAAAAVTHDEPAAQASPARSTSGSGDRPRRTGSAMLLAALALMSGIALRRYGSRQQ